jgi:diguanylate cyclase (GGDEF)-like protein/PAS domain S-box-containing protein
MVNETLPALLKYHAAWDEFVDFQKDQRNIAATQAEVDYARARYLAYLLIVLAVTIAVAIALFTTRETAREIAARVDAEKEVSKLNAGLEERVMQRTSELSEAVKHLNLQAAALEAAANAIVITDCHGTIMWVNHAFTTMTGYSKEEILGKNARLLKSGEQPESYYAELWSTISSGKVWKGEIVNRRKDGATYSEEMTITPLTRDLGNAVDTHFIAIKQDITERMRAQDALVESERRYRSLFENMLEGVAYCETLFDDRGRPIDFVYLDVNNAFGTLTGLENVVGKRVTEVIPGIKESQPELFERYGRVALTDEPERFEIELKALGRWFSISAYSAGNGCFVATLDNITERKRAEEALGESEERFRALVTASSDVVYRMSPDWSEMRQLSGKNFLADTQAPNRNWLQEYIHRDDQARVTAAINKAIRTKSIFELEHKVLSADGSLGWTFSRAIPLQDANGEIVEWFGAASDVTERKQAEESLLFKTALLEAQTETTIDGILAVDESDHIVLTNKQFGLNFGIPDELLNTRDDLIVLKHVTDKVEDPDAFIERVEYLNSHRDEKGRDELRFKNGKIFDRYSAPLVDSKGRYRGRIWYFRDITARKLAEERVQYLAYYDALTGLPNRTLLQDRLAKALASARRRKDKVAILFLDLDRFKDINDSLGHSVADLLLQEVAERLKTWAREQDTVARVGGDEFLIVLTGLKDVADAAVTTERIVKVMTAEFVVQGHSLSIGCSVGISIFPEHSVDGETLIKNADAAMYSAKENGRNRFQFFTEDMNAQVVERLTLENSLRLALDKKELFLVYQPQMDIATGRITGLEALLRWQHPDLGLVPPDRFIRIAENSGLIVPIGEWVVRTACRQARKWQDEGLPAVSVAVNVSAVQFRQEGFCELIRRVLHETGLAPQYLELELTESLLLANADLMLSVVQELKAMGVTLAIDDFGTGYSSFSYLRQFRISKLKIDRVFIRDVAVNPDDAAITTAIISMAKSLRLKVIAEGVEDEAQMSFLRAHQCDEIQGYYFSKPLAVDKVADKLRGDSPKPQVRAQASGKQS